MPSTVLSTVFPTVSVIVPSTAVPTVPVTELVIELATVLAAVLATPPFTALSMVPAAVFDKVLPAAVSAVLFSAPLTLPASEPPGVFSAPLFVSEPIWFNAKLGAVCAVLSASLSAPSTCSAFPDADDSTDNDPDTLLVSAPATGEVIEFAISDVAET